MTATPGGQRAISASIDKTIRPWDLKSGETIRTIECDATALAVLPGMHRFVAGSPDGVVRVFEMETGKLVQTFAGCDSRVISVALADGQ